VLARWVAAHHVDMPSGAGLVPLVRRLCGVRAARLLGWGGHLTAYRRRGRIGGRAGAGRGRAV